jgi:hypothetical protein
MQLPSPVRAVLGLLATAADEAKHLPDRAIELPMLAVSSALQVSLRAQQRYARLAARGDDVLNRRSTGDEPPPWATFDEPVAPEEAQRVWSDPPADDQRTRAASQLLDQILGMDGLLAADPPDPPGATEPSRPATKRLAAVPDPAAAPAKKAPPKPTAKPAKTAGTAAPKKSAAPKTAASKTPASKTPASKATVATSAAKPRTAKTAKATVKKGAAKKVGKTINKPRHTTPSRFDTVDDD